MSAAAWTFLIGLVLGIVVTHIWNFVIEMLDIYNAERDRDDDRKPW